MNKNLKENLIIVHSFPTNSILLKGFYDYLGNFFNVYPIDLPGFTRQIKPLGQMSLDAYAKYLQDEISKTKMDNFILGGVSFGFVVANLVPPDKQCMGILAIEPYINAQSLSLNKTTRIIYLSLLSIFKASGLGNKLWNSSILKGLLKKLTDSPDERIKTMSGQINANTFMQTATLILKYTENPKFHDLPYALVINPNDNTVSSTYLVNLFKSKAKSLFVVKTRVEHYPKNMTPAYFQERVKSEDIEKMIVWFKQWKT